jgi:NAD(P)-dependent dehydrogenase (short-subunit alcohol dehydrogenase family)
VVYELALRGAQVVLLTQHAPSDVFLVEYIEDVRRSTGNQLIYAEQVDLSSLYSIRQFATKWIDNAPARRLDMVILCASTAVPPTARRQNSAEGLDEEWQVNYLANFHLLSILSPALRAQPAHRDVRVIFTTCPSYIGAKFDLGQADPATSGGESGATIQRTKSGTGKIKKSVPDKKPSGLFGLSKLALMVFADSFQKHLNAYQRPDGQPPCTRVLTVDPGFCRTPGTRRALTKGSLWGLLFYLVTWPLWWLVLKSPQQGAQSILYAAMEAKYGRGEGGWMVKECRQVDFARTEVTNEEAGKKLWEFSQGQIEVREKEGAIKRAMEKKQAEKDSESKASSGAAKEQTAGSRRSRKANNK